MSKRPPQTEPDWQCPCGAYVFATRKSCFKCFTPRGATPAVLKENQAKVKEKRVDPNDGGMYSRDDFIEFYGVQEGKKR